MQNFLRESSYQKKIIHKLHFLSYMSLVFFWILFDKSTSDCGSSMCDNFEICKSQFQDSQPFVVQETRVYTECCNLCATIGGCSSFNYDVKTHMCSLLDETSETFTRQTESSINGKYTKASQQHSKHACRSRPCKSDQVCVTTTSGHGHICLKGSTCSAVAPQIDHMTSEMGVLALTSAQAIYTCDTGFQSVDGSGLSVCTEDGKWTTPSLVCEEIDCGQPPAHEYQNVSFVTSTLYLGRAEYTCETGYKHTEGSGTSLCQADGAWSLSTLKCQVINCGQPPTHQHQKDTVMNSTIYMSHAEYTCDYGYKMLEGSGTSICQADETWSVPTLKCLAMNCGNPPAHNNTKVSAVISTLYSANVEYSCEIGYRQTEGNRTSSCQADGSWSLPSLKCQVVDCGTPADIEHMDMGGVNGTTYMSRVNFTCSTGFTSDGGDTAIECLANGAWSETALRCNPIDCGSPPSHNNTKVSVVTSTLYSASVEYSCDTGYRQTEGNRTSSCQADGSWSVPTLKCQVVDCGTPTDIEHMYMGEVNGTTYMSRVNFTCSTGFTSDGGDTAIECLADGTWSEIALRCNIVDCGMPPSSSINQVNVQTTTYQSVALYECGLGFSTQGNGTAVCQEDGQWSDTCQDITNLRGTQTLEASTVNQLQCRNVLSNPILSPDWKYKQKATCDVDEIITGCSAVAEEGTQMYGSWLGSTLSCYTDTTIGARSVARCCKIPGIKCEYIRTVTSSAPCYKNFQLLDCACSGSYGTGNCLSSLTNNSCVSESIYEAFRYAVCCTHDQLVCYVKAIPVGAGALELTANCETGETMTACSAFNDGIEIQKALIEVRNGVDTCVIDPGESRITTLKAFMSCCKYK